MTLRYLPGTGTRFQGVEKLPAAHVLEVTNGSRSLREIWRPTYGPKHALNEGEILDQLDRLLSDVVQEHLMSEVPLGPSCPAASTPAWWLPTPAAPWRSR